MNMLMLFSDLEYLSKEWWVFRSLMKISGCFPYSTYFVRGVADVDIL